MGNGTTRAWRLLRSRRLAVILIAAVVGYSALATLVPQGPDGTEAVMLWAQDHPRLEWIVSALGFHQAFGNPVFLALMVLLASATAACAVERTRRALSIRAVGRSLSPAMAQTLSRRPGFVLDVPRDTGRSETMDALGSALAETGFSVRRGPNVAEGVKDAWGAWGSPLFHWFLVLLFLVVGLGRVTRSEGTIGVRIGETVRDAPSGYTYLAEGPLFGNRFTGLEFRADDLLPDFSADGIRRGAAPTITLLKSGVPVATQRVYANNPLSWGPLLVHSTGNGIASTYSVEDSSGVQIGRVPVLAEYDSDESSTTVPVEYTVADESGRPIIDMRVTMPVLQDDDDRQMKVVPLVPVSIVETSPAGTGRYGPAIAMQLGDSVSIADGQWIRFVSADDWVMLTVANDWSVGFIYGLLALACAGLAVSVLVAPKSVVLGWIEADDGSARIHVVTRHARRDPAFAGRIRESLVSVLPPLEPGPVTPGGEGHEG